MSKQDEANSMPNVEGKGKNLLISLPLKWIGATLVAVCLAWSPVQYVWSATGLAKDKAERKEDVRRSDNDNRTIISNLGKTGELDKKLDALVAATANNTAAINSCTVVNQELAKTCSELREDVRDLRNRVDQLYRKP